MVLETIVNGLAAVFDVFLWPLRTFFLPSVSLILVASALTVIVFVINRALVDKNAVKQIKDKVEETREKLTKAQKEGNKEEIFKHMSDLWQANNQYIRISMKTMLVSLVIVSLFLPWIKGHYDGLVIAQLPFFVPLIGTSLNWIYWYVFVSLGVGWCFRKILGE